jgi:predicted nuclease of predicted toxin-antitoxin system
MARIRYYADEHVPKAVVRGLRQRGVDVVTVVEAGTLGATDIQHLRLANREGRTIFTQDADFLRLAAQGEPHAGIVYAPQHTPVSTVIRGLMLIHSLLDADEITGRIEFL